MKKRLQTQNSTTDKSAAPGMILKSKVRYKIAPVDRAKIPHIEEESQHMEVEGQENKSNDLD